MFFSTDSSAAYSCMLRWSTLLLCMQGSQRQRNERSSMSDPDMYYNYTPTSASAESGKHHLGAVSRAAFPQSVHVPEGNWAVWCFN